MTALSTVIFVLASQTKHRNRLPELSDMIEIQLTLFILLMDSQVVRCAHYKAPDLSTGRLRKCAPPKTFFIFANLIKFKVNLDGSHPAEAHER